MPARHDTVEGGVRGPGLSGRVKGSVARAAALNCSAAFGGGRSTEQGVGDAPPKAWGSVRGGVWPGGGGGKEALVVSSNNTVRADIW